MGLRKYLSHLVSASSWSDSRTSTSSQWPPLTSTAHLPFSNPPPMTRFFSWVSCCLLKIQNGSDRKSHRFILFCRLRIYFPHCFSTGVEGLWIFTYNKAFREPLRARFPAFINASQYWSKTMWTCLQLASDVVIALKHFDARSPRVLLPADFSTWTEAMLLMRWMVVGKVGAVGKH